MLLSTRLARRLTEVLLCQEFKQALAISIISDDKHLLPVLFEIQALEIPGRRQDDIQPILFKALEQDFRVWLLDTISMLFKIHLNSLCWHKAIDVQVILALSF